MEIIGWNATNVDLDLYSNYLQLLLYVSIILSAINIVAFLFLSKKIRKLEGAYAILFKLVYVAKTKTQENQNNVNKLLRRVEPNANNIETLQQQMALVHELLGTVMGASDFIAGGYDSPADRVEGLREKLKWERERRRLNQVNESDFYEG